MIDFPINRERGPGFYASNRARKGNALAMKMFYLVAFAYQIDLQIGLIFTVSELSYMFFLET